MLKTRLWSAAAMLLVLFGVLYCQANWPWQLFVAFCSAVALWEWGRLLGLVHRQALVYAIVVLGLGWMLMLHGQDMIILGLVVAVFLWCVFAPWALFNARLPGVLVGGQSAPSRMVYSNPVAKAAHLCVAAFWVVAAASVLLLAKQQSLVLLISFLAVCWVADVAAYACGKRWGRRKLALSISPGKSWEGAVGGVLAVLVLSWGLVVLVPFCSALVNTWQVQFFYAFGPWCLGLVSVVLASVAVVGDLYESLLKRQCGVKDSSQLLPGHGGVLDRIDAQLPVLPMAWLLWFAATHFYVLPGAAVGGGL